jgi:hypothetical protein
VPLEQVSERAVENSALPTHQKLLFFQIGKATMVSDVVFWHLHALLDEDDAATRHSSNIGREKVVKVVFG